MDLPKRKHNRLKNYYYGENGAYFITICVKNRKKILCDIVGDDAHIVPKPYGTVIEKYIRNVPEIEKYIIMPDHIHMIIRIDNESAPILSNNYNEYYKRDDVGIVPYKKKVDSIVRSLKILTTKEIGKSIFQRSYYDHIIRNEQDYNETFEYIENNPQKWILTHKETQDD